jgi:YDG domain
VADKVYDGNRDATITGRSLSGQVDGDDVSLAGGSAQFDTKHAGVDKTVTGSGFALGGDAKGNYTLASVAGTKADITAKSITGSFTAADKLYDGTAVATISGRSLDGKIAGDDVTLVGGTATFEDANVGQERTVTGTGFELSGADKGNYRLASSTLTTTASIEYDWTGSSSRSTTPRTRPASTRASSSSVRPSPRSSLSRTRSGRSSSSRRTRRSRGRGTAVRATRTSP